MRALLLALALAPAYVLVLFVVVLLLRVLLRFLRNRACLPRFINYLLLRARSTTSSVSRFRRYVYSLGRTPNSMPKMGKPMAKKITVVTNTLMMFRKIPVFIMDVILKAPAQAPPHCNELLC